MYLSKVPDIFFVKMGQASQSQLTFPMYSRRGEEEYALRLEASRNGSRIVNRNSEFKLQ